MTSKGDEFRDTYTEALRQINEAKREDRELPEVPEPEAKPGQLVDLMAALQESVAKAKASRGETEAEVHELPKKKAAARKAPAKKQPATKAAENLHLRRPRRLPSHAPRPRLIDQTPPDDHQRLRPRLVRDATFCPADLTTFCRLDDLGLEVVGQQLHPDHAALLRRVVDPDDWCHARGCLRVPRDSVLRRLAHVPLGRRATIPHVRIRRYRCSGCGQVWRQDTTAAAAPRAKLSTQAVMWALNSVVIDRMPIARIAAGLGVSWHTVNDAVLATGHQLLIADPTRFDGVQVLGMDEHAWRHTRRGDKFVTVIIDLTPVRDGTGPSRLLDMVEGRSKQVFKTWLEAQTPAFRDGIEIVAMDGFTGFKTATAEEVPDAVAVMDPFRVAALAGDALDRCRQRVQQDTCGHRGQVGDPLYGIRRVLRTGVSLLTDRQQADSPAYSLPMSTPRSRRPGGAYQRIVSAYRQPDRRTGKTELAAVIKTISHGVPAGLPELSRLGRTLKQRAADVLAYFDRPGTSNGPTEAINGRLEHLRGTALGFRNLTNYITRSLLDTGGFRPRLHPLLR